MFRKRAMRFTCLAAGLALGWCVSQPLMAMGGYSAGEVSHGLIQNIDYLHHTITVNGQTYAVSPTAAFSGIAGFSVLHIGMPIEYRLRTTQSGVNPGGPMPEHAAPRQADNQQATIAGITWLPGGV